jgi:hypothetical protein
MAAMFCPESGKFRECPEAGCPFYLSGVPGPPPGGYCIKALLIKKELGILTREEKAALESIKKRRR